MKLRKFLITGLIGLFGCVSSPEIDPPSLEIDVPSRWTAGKQFAGAVDQQWWTAFKDPALDETVHCVLDQNYGLASAALRVDQAALQARIAGADLLPSANLSFDPARSRRNFIGFPVGGGGEEVVSTTSTTYGVSLNTSWELDLWGRIGEAAKAARADYEAARADLYGAYLSLAGQTVKAWFALGEAIQQLDLARTTEASFQRTTNQIRQRYERGLLSPLDFRLAASNLADAAALVAQREQQVDAAARQLEVLMGRYPGRNLTCPPGLPEILPEIPAGLPADLVARRPDLCAAERRLAAASARLASSKAALYPRISLTASGGTASEAIGDLLDGDFRVWSLMGNLIQPVFEGGRLIAQIDSSRAAQEQVLADYATAVLNAYAEVETALAAELFLGDREHYLAEAADQSEAAQRLAEDRYRAGLENYITVLESQRRALLNKSSLLSVRRMRMDNRVDLYMALGGGFHGLAGAGPPETSPQVAAAKESAP